MQVTLLTDELALLLLTWDAAGLPLTYVVYTGSSTSPKAVSIVYSRGDTVWYRQRDGTDVPAKASCSLESSRSSDAAQAAR